MGSVDCPPARSGIMWMIMSPVQINVRELVLLKPHCLAVCRMIFFHCTSTDINIHLCITEVVCNLARPLTNLFWHNCRMTMWKNDKPLLVAIDRMTDSVEHLRCYNTIRDIVMQLRRDLISGIGQIRYYIILACRSYSFVCTVHHLIIIIVQTYLKALNL